jgi:hypothetical protein
MSLRYGSEFLYRRPDVELQSPDGARLAVKVQISLRKRVGVKHRVRIAVRLAFASDGRRDLAVDHDMADMDALRPQFPRHALGKRPEAEFWDREIGKARAAAQARGRAGEKDRAPPFRHHAPGRLLADMEAAQAVDAPASLENGGIDIEDAAWLERAGIEHDEIRRGAHGVEHGGDLVPLRHVAGMGSHALKPRRIAQALQLPDVGS